MSASAAVLGHRLPRSLVGTWRTQPSDVLLTGAVGLWFGAVPRVEPTAMTDFGLLAALPVAFFAALAVLMASVVTLLTAPRLSPARLALHLGAFVLIVHGTAPLVFEVPIYPWVYKHIGVVAYIDVHRALDASVDIYQNWPGFFALAAWFDRVAGVGDPIAYAAWAPVYFNLLSCAVLAFAFRSLRLSQRARWLGLFLFVAGNWVGQDYFAPQALAMVLSVAVLGMALRWLRAEPYPAVSRAVAGLASRLGRATPDARPDDEGVPGQGRPASSEKRLAQRTVLLSVFAVVIVTHQLSPFMLLVGMGALTVAGVVRPRWIVIAMAAMTVGYLIAHYSYVDRTQNLFGSLLHPFQNLNSNGVGSPRAALGRRLTALGAPLLVVGLGGLAAVGVVVGLRRGMHVLASALLAMSPALVAFAQSYGGEAVFRIYLFALPWLAALGALAFEPLGRVARAVRSTKAVRFGLALSIASSALLSAFYGSMELYEVRPESVRASQYFYDHAPPGSVLAFVGRGFPLRVSAKYNEFVLTPDDSTPNLLTTVKGFRHRMLGEADLPAVAEFMRAQLAGTDLEGYLVLSPEQEVGSHILGLLPKGSVNALGRALDASADWDVFYRDGSAVIYRFAPAPAVAAPAPTPGLPPSLQPSPTAPESAEPHAAQPAPDTWTVQRGDNLWTVAADTLYRAWDREAGAAEILPYWESLIEANRHHLANPDNPDLIFAGQVFDLPAIPAPT